MIAHTLLFASLIGLLSSSAYLILVVEAARRFCGAGLEPLHGSVFCLPPVAVLKPLHGLEPQLTSNLESFFLQDYPDFELIFGTREADDPALRVVEALQLKYPKVKSRILLSGQPAYPNAKIFTLEKMIQGTVATYIVISDSDACVPSGCLRAVVKPLLNPQNGVVTCVYKGVAAGGFWSKLEALGMSVELTSGVLVAKMLEGMRFALGPIMATRRDVLESIGGIPVLAEYHADDYKLGNLAHASGKNVILSNHVIGHVAMNTSARMSIAHQIRWMRSTRFSRSAGHLGTGLTYAMPFGFLGLTAGFLSRNWHLGLALLLWAYLNRCIQAIVVGWRVISDEQSLRLFWLYPLRDLMGFFVWCGSFLGNEISWRNERYRMATDGKIVRL